jgi:sulfide dehydrogenase cytochrome subunit
MYKQSRPATRLARLVTTGALAAGLVAACGGGGGTADVPAQATAQSATAADPAALGAGTAMALGSSSGSSRPVPQPVNTEGRLLASNCFQCHGTLGTGGFDSIRGGDAKEVLEFLSKPASSDIMAAHAQGYTTAQLQKIIAYLQQ